jgi:hypothetical protein
VDEFRGGTLSHFADFHQEEWTMGILQGGFVTSREPLDLTEKQGRYAEYSQGVQSSGGAGP